MKTNKEAALKVFKKMPDKGTSSDVFEELLFLEEVKEGLEAAKRGNLIEHDEVEKKFAKWLK